MAGKAETDSISKKLGIISLVILALNVAGIILLPVVVVLTKRMLLKMFMDCELELPPLTATFISVPAVAYFLPCIVAAVGLIIKELVISSSKAKLIINIAAVVVASGVIFAYAVAIIVPLLNLLIELQEGQ